MVVSSKTTIIIRVLEERMLVTDLNASRPFELLKSTHCTVVTAGWFSSRRLLRLSCRRGVVKVSDPILGEDTDKYSALHLSLNIL